MKTIFCAGIFLTAMLATTASTPVEEYKSGIKWPRPPVVEPGSATKAPSDAIVLFDGKDMSAFENGDAWIVLSLIHI